MMSCATNLQFFASSSTDIKMPENVKDAWSILGVSENATETDIKKAYKELVKKHHTDKGGNIENCKAVNTAKSLIAAYRELFELVPEIQQRLKEFNMNYDPSLKELSESMLRKEFIEKNNFLKNFDKLLDVKSIKKSDINKDIIIDISELPNSNITPILQKIVDNKKREELVKIEVKEIEELVKIAIKETAKNLINASATMNPKLFSKYFTQSTEISYDRRDKIRRTVTTTAFKDKIYYDRNSLQKLKNIKKEIEKDLYSKQTVNNIINDTIWYDSIARLGFNKSFKEKVVQPQQERLLKGVDSWELQSNNLDAQRAKISDQITKESQDSTRDKDILDDYVDGRIKNLSLFIKQNSRLNTSFVKHNKETIALRQQQDYVKSEFDKAKKLQDWSFEAAIATGSAGLGIAMTGVGLAIYFNNK